MKQRIIYSSIAVLLVFGIFVFGKTSTEKKPAIQPELPVLPVLNAGKVIDSLKENLPTGLAERINGLEKNLSASGGEKTDVAHYDALAELWKDSTGQIVPYVFYLSKGAELDNSEKSLTFAAQFILENMRRESRLDLKLWEAQTAVHLFEQALKLDPSNQDLKIGLGSCYVFGPGMTGNAQESMKGIQQLLEVVREDSNNMKAQMVLGIASVISNQADKGIERLLKVVNFDPHNLEAISWLADAYATTGDVANAKKWYEQSKHIVNNPAFSKEVDERIKLLEQH